MTLALNIYENQNTVLTQSPFFPSLKIRNEVGLHFFTPLFSAPKNAFDSLLIDSNQFLANFPILYHVETGFLVFPGGKNENRFYGVSRG